MTARERVVSALAHGRPDRLPRYEIFLSRFIEKWRGTRNASENRGIHEHYAKIDIGGILASQEGPFMARRAEWEDGDSRYIRDSWGRLCRYSKSAELFEVLETVAARKSDLDGLEFEDPARPDRSDLERLEQAAAAGGRFAPVSGVMGLFMPSHYLRGELNLLTDLADDPPFCHALIGRVAEFLTRLGEQVLTRTNTWSTALWVYDDFGSNIGPLISPDTFATFFVPYYKQMISHWKARGAKQVILHYDANCWAVLDLLIEAGFTGIQGIYPAAGMSIPAVKARYGSQLALIGGMCNVSVLAPGPLSAIERDVSAIVEAARDGGVVIGAHSIDVDVPITHYDHYYAFLDRCDESW